MNEHKRAILSGAAWAALAGLVIILCALWMVRFDMRRLSREQFQAKTIELTESFRDISVRTINSDIVLLPSPNGKSYVEYADSDRIVTEVSVSKGVLTIEQKDRRRWYESIGFYWSNDDMVTRVYLNESSYQSLYLKAVSGDIQVPKEFTFDRSEVHTTSGDIGYESTTFDKLTLETVSGEIQARNGAPRVDISTTSGEILLADLTTFELNVKTVSGDVTLSDAGFHELSVNTTSGNIKLENVNVQGGAEFHTVSGDVRLDSFDAGEITIHTTSGDVTGSLLSPKRFETHTTSGDIDLPASEATGGLCEIHTTSGDIRIRYTEK